MSRVVVGMSGGVDSSVAAYLLKEQGHEVIGMFMKNWHDDSVTISKECPWVEDSADAMMVAEKLDIPFHTIDLSKAYKERIVNYMFGEYEKGRTPNPDVLCNREIKFDLFLNAALKLKADYVATGHYCRKDARDMGDGLVYRLLAGKDPEKDQSYFLCQINQSQLAKALFPLGELKKSKVREIAHQIGLDNADKKDSQGLCFVGKVRLPEFLQQKLAPKKGKIVEVPPSAPIFNGHKKSFDTLKEKLMYYAAPYTYSQELGKYVGDHNGAHFFTVGQRKGLNVGGKSQPLFVLETDTSENVIYTGQGGDHPGLHRQGLFIKPEDVHWIRQDLSLGDHEQLEAEIRIRYRQPLETGTLYKESEGLYIIFNQPQKGITPGQFAAWYRGDELIGSGVINS